MKLIEIKPGEAVTITLPSGVYYRLVRVGTDTEQMAVRLSLQSGAKTFREFTVKMNEPVQLRLEYYGEISNPHKPVVPQHRYISVVLNELWWRGEGESATVTVKIGIEYPDDVDVFLPIRSKREARL